MSKFFHETFQSNSANDMEANSLDSARFTAEMKSIQPYSTKDEYLYAMKEDLAEWFNSMYQTQISANNFIEQLENGELICFHANNVMRAALKVHRFNQIDLANAGINSCVTKAAAGSTTTSAGTPSGKVFGSLTGEFVLYKQDARPQSFQSRDNISNFIKWCRYVVRVRECLMFETDDLILRKNENNFILCLLEIARFGSKFGIQVPTIIKFELEIEAELEREKQAKKNDELQSVAAEPLAKEEEMFISEKMFIKMIESEALPPKHAAIKVITPLEENAEQLSQIQTQVSQEISVYVKESPNASSEDIKQTIDQMSSDLVKFNRSSVILLTPHFDAITPPQMLSNNENASSNRPYHDSRHSLNSATSFSNDESVVEGTTELGEEDDEPEENLNAAALENDAQLKKKDTDLMSDSLESTHDRDYKEADLKSSDYLVKEMPVIENFKSNTTTASSSSNSPIMSSPLSSSISSSNSLNDLNAELNKGRQRANDGHKIVKNLNKLFCQQQNAEKQQTLATDSLSIDCNLPSVNNKKLTLTKIRSRSTSRERVRSQSSQNTATTQPPDVAAILQSQNNLHTHVCSIADRCTCEKKFTVVKLGEGKYRIGNTKNIVFIRILRNHIMVRVGGGWDTLENYLNKHDPCRSYDHCPGSKKEAFAHSNHQNENKANILLIPINSTTFTTSIQPNSAHSSNVHNPIISLSSAIASHNSNTATVTLSSNLNSSPAATSSTSGLPSSVSTFFPLKKDQQFNNVDFTDAKLVIERNTAGKHTVGKILLVTQPTPASTEDSRTNTTTTTNNNHNLSIYGQKQQVSASSNSSSNNDEMHNFFSKNITPLKQNGNAPPNSNFSLFKSNIAIIKANDSVTSSTSLNSINSYLLNHQQKNAPFTPQSQQSAQYSSASTSKTESLLKNKMKKLINRLPSSSSSSSNSTINHLTAQVIQNNYNPPSSNNTNNSNNYYYPASSMSPPQPQTVQQPHGLLKFHRSVHTSSSSSDQHTAGRGSGSSSTPTTGYSSQNEDISSHSDQIVNSSNSALASPPVLANIYTETKLPPRILKKYACKQQRAYTEAILNAATSLPTKTATIMASDKNSAHGCSETESASCIESCGSSSLNSPTSEAVAAKSSSPFSDALLLSSDQQELQKTSDESSVATDVAATAVNSGFKTQKLSSPKAPPRIKMKKYRKSKTTDLSRHQKDFLLENNNNNNHEGDADSLDGSEATSPTSPAEINPTQTKASKLKDSLESLTNMNLKKSALEDLIEKDSLCDFKELTEMNNGIHKSSSSTFQETSNLNNSSRAQWDKSKQDIEFKMQFLATATTTGQAKKSSSNFVDPSLTPISNLNLGSSKSASKSQLNLSAATNANYAAPTVSSSALAAAKKARQLNQAKEKLYQMKKSIDAKLGGSSNSASNLSKATVTSQLPVQIIVSSATPSSSAATSTSINTKRTTPRKVKKRSEERSITTGIASGETAAALVQSSPRQPPQLQLLNTPTSRTTNSHLRNNSQFSVQNRPTVSSAAKALNISSLSANSKRVSASLHNLTSNDLLSLNGGNATRFRRDSYASTVSSVATTAGSMSLVSNTPGAEYKENKAYELRKKSALMNKIMGKTQAQYSADPIYTRSHPVTTALNDEQQQAVAYLLTAHTNNSSSPTVYIGSCQEQLNTSNPGGNNTARKRLFAKKNEKNGGVSFDPNVSIQSNVSSMSSASTAAPRAAKSGIQAQLGPAPQTPKRIESKIASQQAHHNSRELKTTLQAKSRSKSSHDLAANFSLEGITSNVTSNSTQDLLELINQYEAPQGDMTKYQLMLRECDRFVEAASSKAKSQPSPIKPVESPKSTCLRKENTAGDVKVEIHELLVNKSANDNNSVNQNEIYLISSLNSPLSLSPSGASNSPNSMVCSSMSNQSQSPVMSEMIPDHMITRIGGAKDESINIEHQQRRIKNVE